MPQPTKGARLGGSPAHQRLILANLATSLFQHGKIKTTEAKARRLRPYAERLITKAKRGDLHNRREIQKVIRDRETVHRLMHEIGPFFADRNGGYTRITKTVPRQGDNAPMAVIELVREKTVTSEADRARRVAGSVRRRSGTATAAPAPAAPEATGVAESAPEEVPVTPTSDPTGPSDAAPEGGSEGTTEAEAPVGSMKPAAEGGTDDAEAAAAGHTSGSASARTASEETRGGPAGAGRES